MRVGVSTKTLLGLLCVSVAYAERTGIFHTPVNADDDGNCNANKICFKDAAGNTVEKDGQDTGTTPCADDEQEWIGHQTAAGNTEVNNHFCRKLNKATGETCTVDEGCAALHDVCAKATADGEKWTCISFGTNNDYGVKLINSDAAAGTALPGEISHTTGEKPESDLFDVTDGDPDTVKCKGAYGFDAPARVLSNPESEDETPNDNANNFNDIPVNYRCLPETLTSQGIHVTYSGDTITLRNQARESDKRSAHGVYVYTSRPIERANITCTRGSQAWSHVKDAEISEGRAWTFFGPLLHTYYDGECYLRYHLQGLSNDDIFDGDEQEAGFVYVGRINPDAWEITPSEGLKGIQLLPEQANTFQTPVTVKPHKTSLVPKAGGCDSDSATFDKSLTPSQIKFPSESDVSLIDSNDDGRITAFDLVMAVHRGNGHGFTLCESRFHHDQKRTIVVKDPNRLRQCFFVHRFTNGTHEGVMDPCGTGKDLGNNKYRYKMYSDKDTVSMPMFESKNDSTDQVFVTANGELQAMPTLHIQTNDTSPVAGSTHVDAAASWMFWHTNTHTMWVWWAGVIAYLVAFIGGTAMAIYNVVIGKTVLNKST